MPPEETKQRSASVSMSFANIDETESSGILSNLFRANQVFLGGSSMGLGLTKAARFYLNEREKSEGMAVEESFYVIDLGVIVSQVYQWRNYFPRVEPFYGTFTIARSADEHGRSSSCTVLCGFYRFSCTHHGMTCLFRLPLFACIHSLPFPLAFAFTSFH
jgi:hypothetical protein